MGERPIRGMHGYHPTDKQSYATLCTNQANLPEDIAAIPDVFRLMTRDADFARSRNGTAVQSQRASDGQETQNKPQS
jgi:hypothetical protein